MRHGSPQGSLIGWMRGCARLAAIVLGLFLGTMAMQVACAAHDLADMGTVATASSVSHAPTDPGSPDTGTDTDPCGHYGCHHPSAVPQSDVLIVPRLATVVVPIDHTLPLAVHPQRELRPPIR
jgi:hypothetical protein